MRINSAAGLVFVIALGGCGRIAALFGHDNSPPASSGSAASSAAPAAAASNDDLPDLTSFEGEIDISAKAKTSPTPVSFNLLVKNDVVRVDIPTDQFPPEASKFTGGGKVWALLRPAEKKLTAVLDAKKEAIEIDLDQATEKAKAFRGGGPGQDTPSPPPPKVTKTGKKELVAGFSCEDWDIVNADRSKASVCVAEKGASWFHLPLTGIPTEHAWALELMDGKHFPLKGTAFEKDGSESAHVEVTKLDKRTLDAVQFQVPHGYKTVSLDEMMKGLMGPPDDVHEKPHGPHPHHGGKHHH
jgi:hypothetical protein